ncbi:putative alkaline shock family protein YloU [Tumebacillus sp. BK434]|uniref:Asp23/Gls24 family envelope stress response protein n=1 Tax=Tumebacillus avium TaxID=1903704 RepID=A0A1Y0IP84_9BACL|nr:MULTISPECIES: Asp23/Gls24 family envelope stress response protein [Tumebacillus]ARU62388.1 Asp23/Gls24 family envelope stress response protein [Tumebacillus avium]TCP52463.1 putative alkaline shock family protein YloU [Tumebacillus sp. BK434]
MPKDIRNELGTITFDENVIATVAGYSALDCYGLVGMASRKQVKDSISELLGRENMTRGVDVRIQDGDVVVDMYIIVSYGTRISEVAHNVMDKVKYTLEHNLGLKVEKVNVIVQGVRVTGER